MTPADLAAIRERAVSEWTPENALGWTHHATLDRRTLLTHIDTLIRERDSYRALRERIEQGETP